MTGDPIERLRRADPVSGGGSAPAFEDMMHRIRAERSSAVPARSSARLRWPRALAPMISVAATVAVVAVVLIAAGHHRAGRHTQPTPGGAAPSAQVPSPVSLLPSRGGMRGLLFGVGVTGSGSTLRVDFVQCTNCGDSTPPNAHDINWSSTSTDGGVRWQTGRPRVSLSSLGVTMPEGRDVWAGGFGRRATAQMFYASHDSARSFHAVQAPAGVGAAPVTLGGGEAWTLGIRCLPGSCRSSVLHGQAAGARLSATATQPLGMLTRRAPTTFSGAGDGERAYVSEGSNHRLYVTDDDGRHWTRAAYPCSAGAFVRDLTPTRAGVVWANCVPLSDTAAHGANPPLTVRRSDDAGEHWRTPDPAYHGAAELVAASPRVAWAQDSSGALQRTANGGRSWHTVLRVAGPYPAVDIESSTSATLVVAATTGTRAAHHRRTELVAYRTNDGGSRWTHTLIRLPRD